MSDVIVNTESQVEAVVDAAPIGVATVEALATKITGVGVGKITVSITEPVNPAIGDIWLNIS